MRQKKVNSQKELYKLLNKNIDILCDKFELTEYEKRNLLKKRPIIKYVYSGDDFLGLYVKGKICIANSRDIILINKDCEEYIDDLNKVILHELVHWFVGNRYN